MRNCCRRPVSPSGRRGFRCAQRRPERDGRQHQMWHVGQHRGSRRPLGQDTGDQWAEPEAGGHRHRDAPGAASRGTGQFLDPRRPGAERRTARYPRDQASGEQPADAGPAEHQQHGRDDRGSERRGHDPAPAVPVRDRATEQQARDEPEHVEPEDGLDRGRRQIELVLVHQQQRRELLRTPADRRHGEPDAPPGPGVIDVVHTVMFASAGTD